MNGFVIIIGSERRFKIKNLPFTKIAYWLSIVYSIFWSFLPSWIKLSDWNIETFLSEEVNSEIFPNSKFVLKIHTNIFFPHKRQFSSASVLNRLEPHPQYPHHLLMQLANNHSCQSQSAKSQITLQFHFRFKIFHATTWLSIFPTKKLTNIDYSEKLYSKYTTHTAVKPLASAQKCYFCSCESLHKVAVLLP